MAPLLSLPLALALVPTACTGALVLGGAGLLAGAGCGFQLRQQAASLEMALSALRGSSGPLLGMRAALRWSPLLTMFAMQIGWVQSSFGVMTFGDFSSGNVPGSFEAKFQRGAGEQLPGQTDWQNKRSKFKEL
eukprot:TRINITY_DN82761_c0_g1_i1.p1 TRINITY_DN82761_c0_g1~~TRINITY_DN82761_c0_g1_i1.p1  ORF type:complete len:150 (+),score=26.38 TRINITY_DN82761_c0_g1_i1:54-452(+)